MKTLLTVLYNLFASMHPIVRIFLGVGSIALALNTYVNTLWGDLFARVDALAAGSMGSADFSPLALTNYIVPLDTILTFMVAYGTLRLGCASVRIVKSFIPTVS